MSTMRWRLKDIQNKATKPVQLKSTKNEFGFCLLNTARYIPTSYWIDIGLKTFEYQTSKG